MAAVRQRAAWTALAWIPLLAWVAAFRPGLMSADSLEVWRQATEGGWIDLQPPAYTAAMWLSAGLVGSPTLLTLGQTLLLAASLAAVAGALGRAGVPRWWRVAVCVLPPLTPTVGAFAVSLWKDVPFTAALLFAVARLVDVVRLRWTGSPDTAAAWRVLRSLAAWLALAAVLRQNGVLVAVATLAVVALAAPSPGRRRRVAALALLPLVALAAAKVLVYPAVGVEPTPPPASIATFLHDIAVVAARDERVLDASDRALLEEVAPVPAWRDRARAFGCHSANWQWSPEFDWAASEPLSRDFFDLWARLTVAHPRAMLGNRLCVGALAWRPDSEGILFTVPRGVDPNGFGLRTVPVWEPLHDAGIWLIDATDSAELRWLAWRAPVWLYLTYGILGAAAWRARRPLLLLPLAVPAALQLSVLAFNPAQDARYLIPATLACWALLPLATAAGLHSASRR